MATTMCKECAASDLAGDLFGTEYHCAEAVAKAALEIMGQDPAEAVAHATAFGGGFGKSFQEACGALSGALVAIGHLYGRRTPGENWDRSAMLGAAVRDRFIEKYGTTNCAALRERFGKENQMSECRKIVRATAQTVIAELESDMAMEQEEYKAAE